MKRDASIELWRCFCMLAVVVSHVLTNNGLTGFNYVQWHVLGFLWISGHFGINLRFKKIIQLVLITLACYWLTIPMRGWTSVVDILLPHGGWFLPFYLVLMLLSPILESAAKDENGRGKQMVCLGILLIWGWLPSLLPQNAHVRMLCVPGMQGNGLLVLIAVYLFARILGGGGI